MENPLSANTALTSAGAYFPANTALTCTPFWRVFAIFFIGKYRALHLGSWFGTRRSQVQILLPRPRKSGTSRILQGNAKLRGNTRVTAGRGGPRPLLRAASLLPNHDQ